MRLRSERDPWGAESDLCSSPSCYLQSVSSPTAPGLAYGFRNKEGKALAVLGLAVSSSWAHLPLASVCAAC